MFLTLPQLLNTQFSTQDFTNEKDEIKEFRYCRVAWEDEPVQTSSRNSDIDLNYETQFGFKSLVNCIVIQSVEDFQVTNRH